MFLDSLLISATFLQIILLWHICEVSSPFTSTSQNSSLVKICRDDSWNICFGVYVKPQWLLANALCAHLYHNDAKVLSGTGGRDCQSGRLDKIENLWKLKRSNGIVLVKTTGSYLGNYEGVELGMGGDFRNAKNCVAFCQICKGSIEGHPVTLTPCSDLHNSLEMDFGDKICLREVKNETVSYIDRSPIICDGKLIGFALSMNVKTLIGLDDAYAEILEIISQDGVRVGIFPQDNAIAAFRRQKREGDSRSGMQKRCFGSMSGLIQGAIKETIKGIKKMVVEYIKKAMTKPAKRKQSSRTTTQMTPVIGGERVRHTRNPEMSTWPEEKHTRDPDYTLVMERKGKGKGKAKEKTTTKRPKKSTVKARESKEKDKVKGSGKKNKIGNVDVDDDDDKRRRKRRDMPKLYHNQYSAFN